MNLPRCLSLGVTLIWLLAVVGGLLGLLRHANTPGEAARAPCDWPAASTLTPRPGCYNLVLALHPHCPCSHASLEELARIQAAAGDHLHLHLLYYKPASVPSGWEQTDLWRKAQRLPNASHHVDREGIEAQRFGARTSGQALLYGAGGRLLFRGGLTLARGHVGENPSQLVLQALLLGPADGTHLANLALVTSPVFGCPLEDPAPGQE